MTKRYQIVCCWTHNHACAEGSLKTLCGTSIVSPEWRDPLPDRGAIDCPLCLKKLPPLSVDQKQARDDLAQLTNDARLVPFIVRAEHKRVRAGSSEWRRHTARVDGAMRAIYGELPKFTVYRRVRVPSASGDPKYEVLSAVIPFDGRPETACLIAAQVTAVTVGTELHAKLEGWGDDAGLVPAGSVEQGDCFRKRNGEYAYLRISESAIKWLELQTERVYGVSFNGNVTCVHAEKMVHPATMEDMIANRDGQGDWEQAVGVGTYQPDPDPEAGTYQPDPDPEAGTYQPEED